jgi:hypothetical protein
MLHAGWPNLTHYYRLLQIRQRVTAGDVEKMPDASSEKSIRVRYMRQGLALTTESTKITHIFPSRWPHLLARKSHEILEHS